MGALFPELYVEGCVWFAFAILMGIADHLYRSRVVRRSSAMGPTATEAGRGVAGRDTQPTVDPDLVNTPGPASRRDGGPAPGSDWPLVLVATVGAAAVALGLVGLWYLGAWMVEEPQRIAWVGLLACGLAMVVGALRRIE